MAGQLVRHAAGARPEGVWPGLRGWGLSPAFYSQGLYKKLGFPTIEDFLVGFWETYFLQHDANNLLAQLWSWQNADISANEMYGGDLVKALGAIKAKALIMPSETDRYFGVAENAAEVVHLSRGELRPIPTIWGHLAGNPNGNAPDTAFLAKGLHELLASLVRPPWQTDASPHQTVSWPGWPGHPRLCPD